MKIAGLLEYYYTVATVWKHSTSKVERERGIVITGWKHSTTSKVERERVSLHTCTVINMHEGKSQ